MLNPLDCARFIESTELLGPKGICSPIPASTPSIPNYREPVEVEGGFRGRGVQPIPGKGPRYSGTGATQAGLRIRCGRWISWWSLGRVKPGGARVLL